jgi:phosphohistidine phosphatase
MKALLLLRHARAENINSHMRDFDRPLSRQGERAASLVGRFIENRGIQPDLVISSPAERARKTALIVITTASIKVKLSTDGRIYEATSLRLLTVVKDIDEDVNVALLVGHNPGVEELQSRLTNGARPMSTAALANVTLDVDKWCEVRENCGELLWLVTPKDLEQE